LLFPLDRVGDVFPVLALRLPDHGVAYAAHFGAWVLITAVSIVGGWSIIGAAFSSTTVRPYSGRRLLEGCLLAFGPAAGCTWVIAVLVGLVMYRLAPGARSSSWDLTLWLISFAGWLALALFVWMRISDHRRYSTVRRESSPPAPEQP
jgi:hypothetical protein